MSDLVRRYHSYLHFLANSVSPAQKKNLLMTATPEQVHAICEVCYNVLTECIPCTEAQRDRLLAYEKELVNLAGPHVPFRQKKQILVQHGGGFIQDLLSPLLGGISLLLI